MNKKTTGFVAGAAGVALLMSGATFALWSDSTGADGGDITSGNLEVNPLGTTWTDVSDDRTDQGHEINLETFRIVPGDTIRGSFPVDVGLEGDNLVAALNLVNPRLDGADGLIAGLHVTYTVLDAADQPVGNGDAITITLASEDNRNADGLVQVPAATDGTADFTVLVDVTFDETTVNRDLVQSQAALAGSNVSLTQVREGTGFGD